MPGAVHSTVTSGGQVMEGAVVSCTSTENEHSDLLPLPSVAAQRSTVVPSANAVPLGRSQETLTGSQTSCASTLKATGVPIGEEHSTSMGAGQVITGGSSSGGCW